VTTTTAATAVATKNSESNTAGCGLCRQCRHQSADHTAHVRPAAPAEAAIVRQRFCKAHADARADRRRQSDQERIPTVPRRERCGKQWRKRGHRAIHQSRQAGFGRLAAQTAVADGVPPRAGRSWEVFLLTSRSARSSVLAFGIGQFVEQRARGHIARAFRRAFINRRVSSSMIAA